MELKVLVFEKVSIYLRQTKRDVDGENQVTKENVG